MQSNMRILLADIETSPNEAYVWNNKPKWIPANQMKETSRVLCYAYKWLGEPGGVQFDSEWAKGVHIARLHGLLDEADAVITYNGNGFDLPVANREFLLHGLTPPSPYASIDLYKTVKGKFRFLYNSLGYVCGQLGIGSKLSHTGFQLWLDVMNGDEKARRKMELYNKRDVRLLEPLYKELLPWIDGHPNHGLWVDDMKPVCTNCGSSKLHKKGMERTTTQIYQRYSCQSCGKHVRGRNTLVPPEHRHRILAGIKS